MCALLMYVRMYMYVQLSSPHVKLATGPVGHSSDARPALSHVNVEALALRDKRQQQSRSEPELRFKHEPAQFAPFLSRPRASACTAAISGSDSDSDEGDEGSCSNMSSNYQAVTGQETVVALHSRAGMYML
jgi:hypothetical protein